MYSGITGEAIDTLIFIGPTYMQRLQKFVADAVYGISHGPTDAITYQPLDGMSSSGGLRCGEMETWTICAHGSMKFLTEKLYDHSDGYIQYYCRCGKPAVVNHKYNQYQCKYCKDEADIFAYSTSCASNVFRQEEQGMNVGLKLFPRPYTYERYDDDKYKIINLLDK